MNAATVRFARYKNKLPHCAVVSLTVKDGVGIPSIDMACVGQGFVSQGYIEEVPEHGYDDWKDGARAGVRYALSVAEKEGAHVLVTQIEGLTTDTNPTIVGAAAALATWAALKFDAPKEVLERLEAQTFSSWALPHDTIPKFV